MVIVVSSQTGALTSGIWLKVVSGKDWQQLGDTYDVYAGDVIDVNFKVPDRIIGTIKEGRVVGASSSYG